MIAFAIFMFLLGATRVSTTDSIEPDDTVMVDQRVVILPTFCTPNPCMNGGTCVPVPGDLDSKCLCTEGWFGVICNKELRILCEPNPCKNGGTCVAKNVTDISCTCPEGWQGETCDLEIQMEIQMEVEDDPCSPNPCNNDCECRPSCKHELGYVCVSDEGFIGKNCDIPVPKVSCLESEIVIDVSTDFYNQFDDRIRNAYMYIAPTEDYKPKTEEENCQASQNGYVMEASIKLPFSDCGTTVSKSRSDEGSIAFQNRLWINRGGSDLFDMPVPVIDFTCLYDRNYSVISSLMPMINSVDRQVTRSGNFALRYGLCKVPVCQNEASQCPDVYRVGADGQPAVYTVGQTIHFHIEVLTQQNMMSPKTLVSTLEEMFLSCYQDPYETKLADISADGCPVQRDFPVSLSSGLVFNPQSACASFQVPRVTSSGCNTLYLHAKVRLCDKDQLRACRGNEDVLYCLPNNADRKRRSASDDETSYFVIGPINVVRGSVGRSLEELHVGDGYGGVIIVKRRDETRMNTTTEATESRRGVAATGIHVWQVFGLVTLAACFGAAIFYVVSKFSSGRRSHHHPNTVLGIASA